MINSLGSSSFNAAHDINKAQSASKTSYDRLSSGNRINSAKDDAAGLAITDRMSSAITGMNQAIRNTNDGLSMTQTADGALGETTSILQRMRELSVQSGNAIYNDSDRASMNAEFSQLNSELGRISETTNFNGQNLLDGSMNSVFQVGANSGDTINVSLGSASPEALEVGGLSVATAESSGAALEGIDKALSSVGEMRGEMGAVQNRFESASSNLSEVAGNLTEARSRVTDTDIAQQVSELSMSQVREQAGIALQAQANQSAGLTLALLQP